MKVRTPCPGPAPRTSLPRGQSWSRSSERLPVLQGHPGPFGHPWPCCGNGSVSAGAQLGGCRHGVPPPNAP